jgi:uncharacterized RDD family membrane protein YckC
MDFHLSIAGERSGPHTQFHIIEGIREGRLKGDELLWHVGMPDWQPLRTVREFEEFWPVSEETRLQAEAARSIARAELDRPRPWIRFWARTLDYLWFSQVFMLVLVPFLPHTTAPSAEVPLLGPVWMVVVAILSRLLYVPLEAWLLSRFGSTPGRALLLVLVRRLDGGLPDFRQALRRSFQVYVQGIALQLPYVDLIAMLWARMRLLRHGATPWDEANQTRVEHGEPEPWRYLVLGAVILGVVVINALAFGSLVEEMSHLPK